MSDNILLTCYYSLQKSELEANTKLNTLTVTQKTLFSELSDGGNMKHCEKSLISPNFLVWKFCGKAQLPHSSGRIVRNYAKTVPFHKISTPEN